MNLAKQLVCYVTCFTMIGFATTILMTITSSLLLRVQHTHARASVVLSAEPFITAYTYEAPGLNWTVGRIYPFRKDFTVVSDGSCPKLAERQIRRNAITQETTISRQIIVNCRGWPWPAFYSVATDDMQPGEYIAIRSERMGGLFFIPNVQSDNLSIAERSIASVPFYPMWGGLLGDTLLYGALVAGVMGIRRRIRLRHILITWRPIVVFAMVCLTIGSVFTVLVSVYFGGWGNPEQRHGSQGDATNVPVRKSGNVALAHIDSEPGITKITAARPARQTQARSLSEKLPSYVNVKEWLPLLEREDTNVIVGCGWPCMSMWYAFQIRCDQSGCHVSDRYTHALEWREGTTIAPPILLPTGVILIGFAVNTLLYSGMSAIVFYLGIGPLWWRGCYRMTIGMCPRCGYDYGHARQDRCSECGLLL